MDVESGNGADQAFEQEMAFEGNGFGQDSGQADGGGGVNPQGLVDTGVQIFEILAVRIADHALLRSHMFFQLRHQLLVHRRMLHDPPQNHAARIRSVLSTIVV